MNEQSTILVYDDRRDNGEGVIDLVNAFSESGDKGIYVKPEKTKEGLSPSFQETIKGIQGRVKVLIDTAYLTEIAKEIETKGIENIRNGFKDVDLYALSGSEEDRACDEIHGISKALECLRNKLGLPLKWIIKPINVNEIEELLNNNM